MESILFYLLRVSIAATILYLFFKFVLSKRTFHAINRVVVLCMVVMTLVLPIFTVQLPEINFFKPEVETLTVQPIDVEMIAPLNAESNTNIAAVESKPVSEIPWIKILGVMYVVGFVVALLRFVISFIRMSHIIRLTKKIRLDDNSLLCISDKKVSPFSWMEIIVLSKDDFTDESKDIIRHEQAHVAFGHSYDLLFLDLYSLFFWFNPFAWLLRLELQTIHEYQADEKVLTEGADAKNYHLSLIRQCVGEYKFALANNFEYNNLHKRIKMTMKTKSSSRQKWLYGTIGLSVMLCIVVLSFNGLKASASDLKEMIKSGISESTANKAADAAKKVNENSMVKFNTPVVTQNSTLASTLVKMMDRVVETNGQAGSNVEMISPSQPTDDNIYSTVDKMPQFPGGQGELLNFISKNLRYPIVAQENGIQGKVMLRFVVSAEGKVDKVEVVRGLDPACDKEAIRVIKTLPVFIPGEQNGKKVAVWYALPITFKLDKDNKLDIQRFTTGTIENLNIRDVYRFLAGNGGEKQVIYLDGKRDPNEIMSDINSEVIQSMTLLKAKEATDKYGEKGKNGVIEIAFKKKTDLQVAMSSSQLTDDKIYTTVEKMPQFPGGESELLNFIYRNIRYPIVAMQNGIQGKVILRFAVSAEGKVARVEVVRGLDPACDIEAIRVIKTFPVFIPGEQNGKKVAVWYTLPITYRLEDDSKPDIKGFITQNTIMGKKPLLVVDGKIETEKTVLELNPANINAISVIRDKVATDKYGDKGKDGVIEIKMFKKTN